MNRNYCLKISSLIAVTVLTGAILAGPGCAKKDPGGNLLRPLSDPQDYVWRIDGKLKRGLRERYIEQRFNQAFVWKVPRDVSGELAFTLLYESEKPLSGSQFRITVDGKIVHHNRLTKDQFVPHRRLPKYHGQQSFNLPVTLKKNAVIRFDFFHKSPSPEDEAGRLSGIFRLGDLRIKAAQPSSLENVLIISIDTLRADFVGVYRRFLGIEEEFGSFSPNIDALAEEGVVFLNAFTTISSTWPALTSLFMSSMPFQHGVRANGQPLVENTNSFSRLLFSKGFYNVSGRSNAYLLDLGGFDRVRDFFNRDRGLIEWTIPLIEQNFQQRFFFWFHFLGVHAGYLPGQAILKEIENPPYQGRIKPVGPVLKKITSGEIKAGEEDIRHVRTSYAGELLRLDRWLKGIFDTLKAKGIWDQTLIVVTADHGEDLYDHNRHFFHHPSIYNTSLHIPLIIKFPRSRYKGVIRQNVSIMDIAPTLLDYLQIETDGKTEGRSLMPRIAGELKGGAEPVIIAESFDSQIFSIIKGNWKLIYNRDKVLPLTQYKNPYPIGHLELYDLDRDRLEEENRSKSDPERIKNLKASLLKYLSERRFSRTTGGKKRGKLTKEMEERLKTLGYL